MARFKSNKQRNRRYLKAAIKQESQRKADQETTEVKHGLGGQPAASTRTITLFIEVLTLLSLILGIAKIVIQGLSQNNLLRIFQHLVG